MNNPKSGTTKQTTASPIQRKLDSVCIPVSNIEKARDWYCTLFGLEAESCEIMFGHLCPLPMDGPGILLDTMPMWGGNRPEGAPSIEVPAFMLVTDDLHGSYEFAKQLGIEFASEIEHDHWFVIKDPDGNMLMICQA